MSTGMFSLQYSKLLQETQLSLTNRATRLEVNQGPQTYGTIFDMLRMVSYYCAIVTLSVRRTVFWDTRLQKCRDLENRVRGPSKSLKMSPFDREPMTSYWRSTATMAPSRVVSEIFNVEKYRDLEISVKSRSWSLKVVPFERLGMTGC